MMIDVTVVVPTYNRARLICRAIDSILNQTRLPSQILVVDDGSTDNTAATLASYGGHLEYVWQENAGASVARNLGVAHARHPWVAFLDSDDYWCPEHLARIANAIHQTQGGASVYFSDMRMPSEDEGGTLWEVAGFQPTGDVDLTHDATKWVLMKRQPMMLQSAVIRKSAYERVGGLDPRFRLVHDSHLFCKLGVDGAACAVAGIGCVQTAADVTSVRLTTSIPIGSSLKLAEDRLMWRELRRKLRPRTACGARLLRFNAAATEWQMGIESLRSNQWLRAARRLSTAVAADSSLLLWFATHWTLSGCEAEIRKACSPDTGRGVFTPS